MNFSWRSIAISVVVAISLFLARHYYHVYQEHQKIGDFLNARIAAGVEVPLNCPPFGQQKVKFSSDGASTESAQKHMPGIVKHWDALWPKVYEALDQKAKDYGARDHLTEKMDLAVFVSDSSEGDEPKWTVQLTSVAGIFYADMVGTKITNTGADF